jgi:hypothetical protein
MDKKEEIRPCWLLAVKLTHVKFKTNLNKLKTKLTYIWAVAFPEQQL